MIYRLPNPRCGNVPSPRAPIAQRVKLAQCRLVRLHCVGRIGPMANVELPTALRIHAGNQRHVTVAAATVGAALAAVQLAHPALDGFLLDSQGVAPRHIVIFVGATDIRHGQGLATAVTDDTVITVLLPVAGGAGDADLGPALTSADIQRYGRQLLLPWMSGQAQRRLRAARVSIVLIANDPASHWLCLYLAHAGVGHLQLYGALHVCDGPLDQRDVLGSPLLGLQHVGVPRAARLQHQLTQRLPQLSVTVAITPSATDAVTDNATGTRLLAQGNGSITHAMWQGSHVAATWLRHFATHAES